MTVLFWIFLDQICPKWIKLDQTWSNWISHQSKNVTIKSCHIYKMDQTWLKLFGQEGLFGSNGLSAETVLSKNTCVKFEVAFWLQKAFFKWICLTSQSIERFGSPLMAESFQACFTCILPDYMAHGITKEFWKNGHFENRRAGFLLRCQNSLR